MHNLAPELICSLFLSTYYVLAQDATPEREIRF